MGTNFYVTGTDEKVHIGKRSAAGPYCWDCKRTLCQDGEGSAHATWAGYIMNENHVYDCHKTRWFESCPFCGARKKDEDWTTSSAGRELGFNKSKPKKKKGVLSCSSFSWAIAPVSLKDICATHYRGDKPIINEYGDQMTLKEFQQILEECPIQYLNMMDKEFS
jgi:hypothetical protein